MHPTNDGLTAEIGCEGGFLKGYPKRCYPIFRPEHHFRNPPPITFASQTLHRERDRSCITPLFGPGRGTTFTIRPSYPQARSTTPTIAPDTHPGQTPSATPPRMPATLLPGTLSTAVRLSGAEYGGTLVHWEAGCTQEAVPLQYAVGRYLLGTTLWGDPPRGTTLEVTP